MKFNLTTDTNITKSLLLFSLPMILGNILQQFYNIVDTWVVGKYVGKEALASVGASYTLMTFLNSVFIGLCMGSGALFAFYYGSRNHSKMKKCMDAALVFIGGISVVLMIFMRAGLSFILWFLRIPEELRGMTEESGRIRCGTGNLYLFHKKRIKIFPASFSDKRKTNQRDFTVFYHNLCTAVRYEFWNIIGAGIGKQFRHHGNGGICGGSQNRYHRIYAGTGVWKRLLHVHLPEFWSKEETTGRERDKKRLSYIRRVLPSCINGYISMGRTVYENFCQRKRERNHSYWHRLFTYRRSLLYRYWNIVPFIWIFPGNEPTGSVAVTDSNLPWHQSLIGIHTGAGGNHRGLWNMVVHSHRLGAGRYGRHLYDEEKSETDGRMMNYRKSCSDFATKRRNRLSISCCKSATISRYSSFARCFVRPIIFSHSITGIALFAFRGL